ncbi:molybdenum ABC transporter ATP-binding protein ModC [Vibrio sp. McD22-P3]|uniref:molybdenum ABC transporter ATP-binding protein ModC n=1 Tax=Vibrio sp. McD22-P3 TaxID=2724880 RepID=UPI001F36D61A|nr:molybdenum ABC transporter ATP-binding protein ModC [Vibrio sp. McD22-P3]MCF4174503.1 molybdenum ABC transporter ATP-binding protein ModC [Vibrio sp. McD22-P3]
MNRISLDVKKNFSDRSFHLKTQLPAKGITAIFGRSGAGKTTLINLVSGLVTPDSGLIEVADRVLFDSTLKLDVAIESRQVGYVFQDARLFPHMTVSRNLRYGVTGGDPAYFNEIVGLLAIGDLLNRYPSSLSGGEKQRVAIGRALLSKPQILLMDEPLASLDISRKRELMPFLEKLSHSIDIPILYVTHSLNEILRLAQHLVVIEDGKVVESDTIENVWSSPIMQSWQSFSDRSSLFKGEILEQNSYYGLTKVALTEQHYLWVQHTEGVIGEHVRLRVRASDVSIALERPSKTSIRNILSCTVEAIHLGRKGTSRQSVEVILSLTNQQKLIATVTQWAIDDLALEVGQKVYAQIKGVSVSQRDVAIEPQI